MGDFGDFAQRMGVLANRVPENADKLVRKVAMAADQTIVFSTPVDKGGARLNWIASLDTPSNKIITEFSTASSNAAFVSTEEAAGIIADYDGDRNSEINITNNLPYIEELNDGSSAQAPAGFVQAGVVSAVRAIDGAKLLD